MRNEISEVFAMYSMVQGKKENNKLKKLLRQINYYKRTSFVAVPPLFGHFEADFDCISDFDDT